MRPDPALGEGPHPYDALLLVSFGGPERPEDVVAFLENVTRGKAIPKQRLDEVAQHYFAVGGRSPINDQNRALVAAIREDLDGNGLAGLPIYWGNRNWAPYLEEAFAQMRADGIERVACLLTSAYSSYSGCRQYRENLAEAAAKVQGGETPRVDRLRHYFNHPGFVEAMVDATLGAIAELGEEVRGDARLLFVTHSIPVTMNQASGPVGSPGGPGATGDREGGGGAYASQHLSVVSEITERVRQETGHRYPGHLVYCSRSGPPEVPWLEPDINDRLEELAAQAVPAAVVVPIGFVSDHMEVIHDLDTEARASAEKLGIELTRAPTAGLDPRFVSMVRDLLLERSHAEGGGSPTRAAVGSQPASWDVCPMGCCANPRGPRPALAGQD